MSPIVFIIKYIKKKIKELNIEKDMINPSNDGRV